ncbi:MAG: TRAP transporter substrate-binding protein [Lentisphaeria bacterium]|nr:TRAP transporter substrate-binding protein [Lentisphaeria bacterium]
MKNRRFLGAFVAVAVAVAVFVGTGCRKKEPAPQARELPAVTLSYAIFFPASHIQCKVAEEWAAAVQEQSSGKITINIHPGASLLAPDKTYDGVVQGVADIGMSCFAYTRGRFPLLEGVDLPMGYPDGKTATAVANRIVSKYNPEELKDVHVLYVHAHGPGILASRRPVSTFEELKGLKVRATGLSGKIAEKLGAAPVGMSQNETYEALRKGVVDATLCPIETLKGWRQGEVIESVTRIPGIAYTTAMFVVMNRAKWEALPAEYQNLLTQLSAQYAASHGEAWDQADTEGRAFVDELKRTVVDFSETDNQRALEAMKPILDDYVKNTEAAGLPGARVLEDIRAMVRDARAQ